MMKIIRFIPLLLLCVLTQQALADNKVCFYEHAEYRGAEWCYHSDISWIGAVRNDRISSIKLYGDAYVDIYQHDNYGGSFSRVMANTYRMDELNDGISSFRVGLRQTKDFACLFEHPGFRGTPYCLQSGQQQNDLNTVALGRNQASSLMLVGDAAVDVYDYPGLRSDQQHQRLSRSSSNLDARPGGWLDDNIDSLRVLSEQPRPAETASDINEALALAAPVRQANVLTAHNAYNSTAYFSGQLIPGPNQRRALIEQLQLGVRSFELDVRAAGDHTRVCHATDCNTTSVTSVRRLLAEIDSWLKGADNNDVVFIYLEDNIAGNPAGYQQLQRDIAFLGDLVYTPGTCLSGAGLTLQQLLQQGKRIFFYKDGAADGCEQLNNVLIDFERSVAVAGMNVYDNFYSAQYFRRAYECNNYFCSDALSAADALTALENGLNTVAMDMLDEQQLDVYGGRLNTLLWAIGPEDTDQAYDSGRLARFTAAGQRYMQLSRDGLRPYACRDDDGRWLITAARGAVSDGSQVCAAEFPGSAFDVPLSVYEARQLRQQMTSTTDLHLNFGMAANGWQAGLWGALSRR